MNQLHVHVLSPEPLGATFTRADRFSERGAQSCAARVSQFTRLTPDGYILLLPIEYLIAIMAWAMADS